MFNGSHFHAAQFNASHAFCFALGLGFGVGLMYFTDPQSGRRRRAVTRDQAFARLNDAVEYAEKTARDLGNRAYGTVHEARKVVTAAV